MEDEKKGKPCPPKEQGNKGGKSSSNRRKKNGKKGKENQENKPAPNEDRDPNGQGLGRKQNPFWYAASEEEIKLMASVAWLESMSDDILSTGDFVPGLMVLNYKHSLASENLIGEAGSASPNYATRAATAYYEYVTQGFTGGVPFEAADQMMTALSAESLYALMIEGKRAFGLCKYFPQFNKNFARTIVEGLGFDFDDFSSNRADFVEEYNLRVKQINDIIAVPQAFFIGDRWEYLASGIFVDVEDADFASAYAYSCTGFLKYDPIYLNTGTCLKWYDPKANGLLTQEKFFAAVDALIGPMDEDKRDVFGAVRRVYTDGELKKMSELTLDFITPIVINDVVAAEVHNAKWLAPAKAPAPTNAVGLFPEVLLTEPATDHVYPQLPDVAVWQDQKGGIHSCIFTTAANVNYADDSVLLDMYGHLVNPSNILDVTANIQFETGATQTFRYLPTGSTTPASVTSYLISNRSEVLTGVKLVSEGRSDMPVDSVYPSQALLTIPDWLCAFSHIDAHPLIGVYESTKGTKYLGEIDRYTIVSKRVMGKMHGRCMYQMLAMPKNSRSVTK